MDTKDLERFEGLPQASSCRLINYTKYAVVRGVVSNTFILTVSGRKPWLTMKVELHPRIYIRQPEYWAIEVVGCQSGIGLPTEDDYSVTLDISSVRGTKGIELISAAGATKIDVP